MDSTYSLDGPKRARNLGDRVGQRAAAQDGPVISTLNLIPISIGLALIGLVTFIRAARTEQYDDPEGDAERILEAEDKPLERREP